MCLRVASSRIEVAPHYLPPPLDPFISAADLLSLGLDGPEWASSLPPSQVSVRESTTVVLPVDPPPVRSRSFRRRSQRKRSRRRTGAELLHQLLDRTLMRTAEVHLTSPLVTGLGGQPQVIDIDPTRMYKRREVAAILIGGGRDTWTFSHAASSSSSSSSECSDSEFVRSLTERRVGASEGEGMDPVCEISPPINDARDWRSALTPLPPIADPQAVEEALRQAREDARDEAWEDQGHRGPRPPQFDTWSNPSWTGLGPYNYGYLPVPGGRATLRATRGSREEAWRHEIIEPGEQKLPRFRPFSDAVTPRSGDDWLDNM
jgi:hypothetical protein